MVHAGSRGACKTALLKVISVIDKITGRSVERLVPHKIVGRDIANVPQCRRLLRNMAVLENLESDAVQALQDG